MTQFRLGDLRQIINEALEQIASDEDRMDTFDAKTDASSECDLKKVHCEKLGEVYDFNVYSVDGEYVDIDFVAGGNPGRYSYVPKDEIWVEEVYDQADTVCSVFHEIIECTLMTEEGMDYSSAHDVAAEHELKLRQAIDDGEEVSLDSLGDRIKEALS